MNKACFPAIALLTTGLAVTAAETEATDAAPAPLPAPLPSWTDSLTLKGDFRYRFESIGDDSKRDAGGDTYTRQRDRIRARLGAEANVNDRVKAGLELSTGRTDPVSGNQSLGDGFGKEEFRLSLAYLEYDVLGDLPGDLRLLAGKMKNPFLTFPDDLVWDSDLTPEGLAFRGSFGEGPFSLLANGGYFWVEERSSEDDLMLLAAQAALRVRFAPKVRLTVGASYYGYQNIQGTDVVDWEDNDNAYGNSTVDGSPDGDGFHKAWAADFSPMVGFAMFDMQVADRPLVVYAQMLRNPDADAFDQGHLLGVSYGKAKEPGTWEIGYSYAELEKDATLGMFTDSDRWGGGTDGKGHKVYGKVQLMKRLQAAVTYFANDKKISDPAKTSDYERLQIDLVASF